MTYDGLLEAIYTQFETLRDSWEAERLQGQAVGVFAFLPDGYISATAFEATKYEFWSMDRVREYLAERGNKDESYLELAESLAYGEEFLVLIVEDQVVNHGHPVHIHRITRVGLN